MSVNAQSSDDQLTTEFKSFQDKVNGSKPTERPIRLKKFPSRPSQLQRQIEKQRDISRKACKETNASQTRTLLRKERLVVPKAVVTAPGYSSDRRPLVSWDTESDNEYELNMSDDSELTRQCNRQLLKDGFRLDEVSDDEDLDLIPPKPVDNQCGQCGCVIQ
ncbi:protein FAM219A-like [Corticium candelabrum]|uniref:protein FAM219A-like n=1 Tax=Corticium candelabrum TaxID=121492 RepID=UPI002E272811|nr:protein FAM219A-like [Corticium candelabrum]